MATVALTVCGPAATRDLTIPSAVPLALLTPALADEVAPDLAVAQLQLASASGTPIDLDLTADEAGIADGQVIVMDAGPGQASTAVYDDPAAALAAQQVTTPGDGLVRIAAALGIVGAVALVLETRAALISVIPTAGVLGIAVLLGLTRLTAVRRDVVAILATALALGALVAALTRWSLPAAIATAVVTASYLPVVLPSTLLRFGQLRTRFTTDHSPASLLVEATAARRIAALRAGALWGATLGVGLGAGALLAWPHPATASVAGCALTAAAARLTTSPNAGRALLLLLLGSAGYAGAIVLPTSPSAAQLWSGVGVLTLTAVLAAAPIPGPTALRLIAAIETLARAALGPLLLWVWGALDAVVLLIGSR